MVFSSLFFLFLFLPLNLILYFSTKNIKIKNAILIVFSLFFYAWGEPIWVGLLILSSFIDYLNGLLIEKYRGKSLAKLGIVSTLIFNLGILFTFKYSDFIVENINFLFHSHFQKPGFLLPIGISFYTFQTISYTIDVYKGEVKAQRSFWNFLLFVSLFHQLVAGPIVRYVHIANEIENRIFSLNDFSSGVTRFCKGLFKKVFFANIAGELATQILDKDFSSLTTLAGWYGIVLYSFQIYFDFSGYSDMAIGLGRMFGFHYHENFKHPYISQSITDFWRRWHISLSTCFRDYLYIPLGGNKKFQIRNILIVWGFTGLWHGASWNFVLWGLYFGLLLILEKYLYARILEKVYKPIRHLYALFFIVVGWAIFYFTDLNLLLRFLKIIFGIDVKWSESIELKNLFMNNIYWFLLALLACLPVYSWFQQALKKIFIKDSVPSIINLLLNVIFLIISVALLVGSTYNPFIYFRF
jgi:alginate O-acetyltransferase complex protein AlgI